MATASSEQGQAVSGANTLVPFHFPTATLAYFQFVFAAITPLLFVGAFVGSIAAPRSTAESLDRRLSRPELHHRAGPSIGRRFPPRDSTHLRSKLAPLMRGRERMTIRPLA